MPTTITINERTKERLSDYKFGDLTFDDVINMLMNKVSIEDISAEHIKEHYRRLADFKGISKEEFKSRLKKTTINGS
jgi:predicted CopG family antitoxin